MKAPKQQERNYGFCSDNAASSIARCGNIKNPIDTVFLNEKTMEVFDKDKNKIGKAEFKNGIWVVERNIHKPK